VFHRHITRYDFGAIAEVVDLESREDVIAVTRDLSLDGCFVKTRMPLPSGTEVRLRIRSAGSDFAAVGNVTGNTSEGMEIEFVDIAPKDRAVIEGWLNVTAFNSADPYTPGGSRGRVVQIKNRLRLREQIHRDPSIAPKPKEEKPKLLADELLGRARNLIHFPGETRH
jgi:PilZ domain-containing protein